MKLPGWGSFRDEAGFNGGEQVRGPGWGGVFHGAQTFAQACSPVGRAQNDPILWWAGLSKSQERPFLPALSGEGRRQAMLRASPDSHGGGTASTPSELPV